MGSGESEPKVSIQSPDKGRRGYDSSTFFNSLLTSAFLLRLGAVEWNWPCWRYRGFLNVSDFLLCFIIEWLWFEHTLNYLRCPWWRTLCILCGFETQWEFIQSSHPPIRLRPCRRSRNVAALCSWVWSCVPLEALRFLLGHCSQYHTQAVRKVLEMFIESIHTRSLSKLCHPSWRNFAPPT